MNWLYSAQLTIGGQHIFYREIAGDLISLLSAIGGMRRRVWAWPIGIVGNALLFTVFLGTALGKSSQAPLFGQAARQVFFAVTSVYGWHRWARGRRSSASPAAITPRWATGAERSAIASVAVVGVAVCYVVFRAVGAGFPVPWWYYVADSWIFVGSMVATYAMARGWVDFWLCWIAVDLVGVPELLHFHYYPSATLFAIYAGFVVWGFAVWRRVVRAERQHLVVTPLQEATS